MIKLCYKEYPFKMSLGAMKQFKAATGKDLWYSLLSFQEVYSRMRLDKVSTLELTTALNENMQFDDAAEVFNCLIKQESKSVPLDEIKDAMYRVGWLPHERPDNMSDPWVLVMVKLTQDIDNQMAQELKGELKKKSDTSE